jgi:hypothetical protein
MKTYMYKLNLYLINSKINSNKDSVNNINSNKDNKKQNKRNQKIITKYWV